MKSCGKCGSENNDDARFCRQCGAAFSVAPVLPADATVRWQGQKHSAAALVQKDVPVDALFGTKTRLVIGRAEDCDVCLPHPMVSRYHALAERLPDGVRLRDLGSVNGLWVNGQRVKDPVSLQDGDRVGVGPFLFTLHGGAVHALDNSVGLRLEARHLERVVPVPGGTRKLLDDINLVVNPGEFLTILGPSGCGKSTLMDCLNGRRRATSGLVLANGEDFYRHFDNFRQSLGYVPQKDIVHGGLTVYKALLYTARLRLPTDTSRSELHHRVEAVLQEMELVPHQYTPVERLSGGQIKRVSLGAELLARPSLLYIDEATSGLDAGTEAKMMRLFRRLSDEGRSIICITHALENVDQCHLILILARGKMIYLGPPEEAPEYFQVKRISDIYERIAQRDPEAWSEQFRASRYYTERVIERRAASSEASTVASRPPSPDSPPSEEPPSPASLPLTVIGRQALEAVGATGTALADRIRELTASALDYQAFLRPIRDGFRQFGVLTMRYLELLWNDRRSLFLLLLQAPLVAVIILVAFYDKDYRSTIPVPRPFNQQEREALNGLKELRRVLLAREANPDAPETEKLLNETRVTTQAGGKQVTMTGRELLDALASMQMLTAGTPANEVLKHLSITATSGGKEWVLNKQKVNRILDEIKNTDIVDRLAAYKGPVVPIGELTNPRFTYMILFILVVVVMWFGCNNASKEIVKEEAIYSRERAVNLGIVPYLASKFVVQMGLVLIQIVLLVGLIFGSLYVLHANWPDHFSVPPIEPMVGQPESGTMPYMLNFGALFMVLFLLGLAGVAMGLALSAYVNSPDKANALLPYVMIPQLIFGGGMMSVGTGILFYLAAIFSSVYWAYRAVHLNAHQLPSIFPMYTEHTDELLIPCLVLMGQMVALLLLTALFLKRKDVRQG